MIKEVLKTIHEEGEQRHREVLKQFERMDEKTATILEKMDERTAKISEQIEKIPEKTIKLFSNK